MYVKEVGCLAECGHDLPGGNVSKERFEEFWRTMLWDNGFGPDRAPAEGSSVFFTWFKGTCTLMLVDHDKNWWERFREATQACADAHDAAFIERRFCCTVENRLACRLCISPSVQ